MKKIIFILTFIALINIVNAQYTTPRFGTTSTSDNTGRSLTYALVTIADVAGNDTITLKTTNAWETIVKLTLTDSVTIKYPLSANKKSYYGDNLKFLVTGAGKVKFISSDFLVKPSSTPLVLTTGLGSINFIYRSSAITTFWQEQHRFEY